MADVVNRITKEFILSVNTPDYPVEDWIINPDLTAVEGIPQKYWKIIGDTIVEMNQSEKDAVDLNIENNILLTEYQSFQENDFETSNLNWETVLSINPENNFLPGKYQINWLVNLYCLKNTSINLQIVVDNIVEFKINNIMPNKWITQSGFIFVNWLQERHEVLFQVSSNNKSIQITNGRLSTILVRG